MTRNRTTPLAGPAQSKRLSDVLRLADAFQAENRPLDIATAIRMPELPLTGQFWALRMIEALGPTVLETVLAARRHQKAPSVARHRQAVLFFAVAGTAAGQRFEAWPKGVLRPDHPCFEDQSDARLAAYSAYLDRATAHCAPRRTLPTKKKDAA